MKTRAYAKINLTLDFLSKREDGYHIIDSVMQTVSLCDNIYIEKSDKTTVCCDIREINNENNIVFSAANEFFKESGIIGGAEIKIQKNIPVAAGLGGGSADAAAVLKALNVLFDTKYSVERLAEIGLKIGADIPFCIYGGTARVGGIGEKITPLNSVSGYGVLLIKSGEKESTAQMYKLIDKLNTKEHHTEKFIEELNKENLLFKNVGNAFLPVSNQIGTVEKIKSTNPLCVSLSGSGPTVFAVYKSVTEAEAASKSLVKLGYSPILTEFI